MPKFLYAAIFLTSELVEANSILCFMLCKKEVLYGICNCAGDSGAVFTAL